MAYAMMAPRRRALRYGLVEWVSYTADVLEFGELPDPEPAPGQVLVRVHAVACNFPDILVCQGRYQEKPALPFTPGLEIAGEVVAVGDGARAALGDRVLGTPPMGHGGYAELATQDTRTRAREAREVRAPTTLARKRWLF